MDNYEKNLDEELNDFLEFLKAIETATNIVNKQNEREKKKEEPGKKEPKEKKEEAAAEKPEEKEKPVEPSARKRVLDSLKGLRRSVDDLEVAVGQYVPKQAQERTGKWIMDPVSSNFNIMCSECLGEDKGRHYYRYCPHCGTKMRNGRQQLTLNSTKEFDWSNLLNLK